MTAKPGTAATSRRAPTTATKTAAGSSAKRATKRLEADPLDWVNFRGPEQNGISRETGLDPDWDVSGKNVVWKNTALGTRSTPIVMHGKLYTLARYKPGTPEEGEMVACVNAETGKQIWENHFNVFLSDVPDTRVSSSYMVGDPSTGRVYAMGVNGYFECLEGDTGEVVWSHSLMEEYGLLSTYGGRTNVPVLHENLVITSAVTTGWGDQAKPCHRFLAFDKGTGEPVWISGTRLFPGDTTYSVPTVTVLGGQAAMVFGSGDGSLWAFQPRTGKPIWHYEMSLRGMNLSPLVVGDTVYMGQSEETTGGGDFGTFVAINGVGQGSIKPKNTVWRTPGITVSRSSPVLVDGRLYVADDTAKLYVLDAKTGEQIGTQKLVGTIMRGSLLYADGLIYAMSTSAWHVLKPSENGVQVLHRARFASGEEAYGSPIVSHGHIYVPTTSAVYCIGKRESKPKAEKRPDPPKEKASEGGKVAQVQVTPVESLIKPGEKVKLHVKLFNAEGQPIKDGSAAGTVTYSVEGPGKVSNDGVYQAESTSAHSGVVIKAKVAGAEGVARVRVIPPLPWKFNFADGEVPVTWVGARYRHVVRDLNGEKVMVKITTIPKGTRSQSWMGPTNLHDYTIQADVRGEIKGGRLPDMGLIAQRYTLDLMGAGQQLQVRMWTSVLDRFVVNKPYPWKNDVWYTVKFQVSNEAGRTTVRGKVWPRGDSEPRAWLIEAVDEAPNKVGSPGLFGNATNAEVFIDNITVTPNAPRDPTARAGG